MKDRFETELLPTRFYGKGTEKDCQFKQLKRDFLKCLYVVTTLWDNSHFEVILIFLRRAPIFKDYHEIYPSDKYLDLKKWRFNDYEEALNFFNNLKV